MAATAVGSRSGSGGSSGNPVSSAGSAIAPSSGGGASSSSRSGGPAVLTVSTVQPQAVMLQPRVAAAGAIAAWQEVTVSLDAPVGRVLSVAVQPGDQVRRGQRLAQLDTALAEADGQRLQAALAEARAAQAEAEAQWRRVQQVLGSGVLSPQQESAAQAAAAGAAARVQAQQAALAAHQLRLRQAQVLAPVDGVVLRLGLTVGQAPMPGQELVRLQREGRLEWRAELPAAALSQLRPGQLARVQLPDGQALAGRLRQVAPVVDPATRQGIAVVSLAPSAARAGMFVRGEIELGEAQAAWTLPASALRPLGAGQGVFVLQPDGRVRLRPVALGPALPAEQADAGRRVAVTGLDGREPVVADGGAFLNDGDRVRTVAP